MKRLLHFLRSVSLGYDTEIFTCQKRHLHIPSEMLFMLGHVLNRIVLRCRAKNYPAMKYYPPPVTLPSVLSAVGIAHK